MGSGSLPAAVRAALAEAGDPERALAQQAYMKSAMPYRGLTAPELKRLLRPLLGDPRLVPGTRTEWEAAVRELWDGAAAFVEPDQPEALAEALCRLIADPSERERLGRQAQDRARLYTVDAMADAYWTLYHRLASIPPRPHPGRLACAS